MAEKVVIGSAELWHGDCLDVLPLLQPGVHAVVMDQPYNIPTQAAQTREITRTIGDLSMIEASFRLLFDQTLRLTGDTGRHFVFGDGVSYPVVFRAMYGKASTALLVWDKGRIGMGREFRKRHELVMHAWGALTPVVSSEGTGFADVLQFPPVPAAEQVHPAQKPTQLSARCCGFVAAQCWIRSWGRPAPESPRFRAVSTSSASRLSAGTSTSPAGAWMMPSAPCCRRSRPSLCRKGCCET